MIPRLLLVLFLTPTYGFAVNGDPTKVVYPMNTYLRTFEDFHQHTQLHIKRVQTLALQLYLTHPEQFPGLDVQLVSEFMQLHDLAKISKFNNRPPMLHSLFQQLQNDGANMIPIIAELNARDFEVRYQWLLEKKLLTPNGLPTSEAQLLLMLENICDLVDRGMNEVSAEEFGRKMRLASEILNDPKEMRLAKFLERNYQTFTQSLRFVRQGGSCRNIFAAIPVLR